MNIDFFKKILEKITVVHRGIRSRDDYVQKIHNEIDSYRHVENVANLPAIHGYWADKYVRALLEPFGFSNEEDFYFIYLRNLCNRFEKINCRFIALGSGNCDLEIALALRLRDEGHNNFSIECIDLNPNMLERGRKLAEERGISGAIKFTEADINRWVPNHLYHAVIANHALHHFLELEHIFDGVKASLMKEGYFLTHDMIGRNGHMRWPESLFVVNEIWSELPERYKYNHLQRRLETEYDNFDCSIDGFEGIRAQDILPLLMKRFQFELFVPFANIIDVFVDRCFGHNFDASDPQDLALIDRIQEIDQEKILNGEIKPTHMYAAMRIDPPREQHFFKHLTPQFCFRDPDQ